MMRQDKKKNILTYFLPFLLTSCSLTSYSRPVTQATAREAIATTQSSMRAKNYNDFSQISLHSYLEEDRITSIFTYETFNTVSFDFRYVKEPYNLSITGDYSNHRGKQQSHDDFRYDIIYSSTEGYLVSFNGADYASARKEEFSKIVPFIDFPSYIKSISTKLVDKALELIDSVGSIADSKDNGLAGFQTSSKGGDDLRIDFTAQEGKSGIFDSASMFFEEKYDESTAKELNMYMSSGLIWDYNSTYTFVIGDETEYYVPGTYEASITNTISYVD